MVKDISVAEQIAMAGANTFIPGDRADDTGFQIEEKELIKFLPQMRPYAHIMYRHPSSVEELIEDYLPSKLWRINNLYKVKTKAVGFSGGGVEGSGDLVVDFKMKREQLILYAQLWLHPRAVVLKSRQVGISTAGVLFQGDNMFTRAHMQYGIIAQNQEAANGLKDKITFAYDNMPSEIKAYLGIHKTVDNTDALGLSNGSHVRGKLSFRSGTLQGLVWTEVGKIASEDPKRITETLSGSLPAIATVKDNWVIQESTAEGKNYFHTVYFSSSKKVGQPITMDAYRPLFFSWLTDKACHSNIEVEIGLETAKVIEKIEKEYGLYIRTPAYKEQLGNVVYSDDFEFRMTNSQRWWIEGKLESMGGDLELFHREYPHTPESAFFISDDSSWFRSAIARMRLENRIRYDNDDLYCTYGGDEGGQSPLYNPSLEVWAYCDIGLSDNFHIILGQNVLTDKYTDEGIQIWDRRVLGNIYGSGVKTDYYAEALHACPYDIACVVLPHDGSRGTVLKDSVSVEQDFRDMGFETFVVDRTTKKVQDILYARRSLEYTIIDGSRSTMTLDSIEAYKKKYNKTMRVCEDTPVHDWASHATDAYLCMIMCPVAVSTVNVRRDAWEDLLDDDGYNGHTTLSI